MAASLLRVGQSPSYANLAGVRIGSIGEGERNVSEPEEGEARRGIAPAVGYLEIFLRKDHPDVDLKLTSKEIAALLFDKMKIPPENVTGVSQGDFRILEVEMNVETDRWRSDQVFKAKQGVSASGAFPARERWTWVSVQGAPLNASDKCITDILGAFGEIKTKPKKVMMEKAWNETEMDPRLSSVWGGTRKCAMVLKENIPNFAFVGDTERRVRIYYAGQRKHCTWCGERAPQCESGLVAAECRAGGTPKADLKTVWREIYEKLKPNVENTEEETENENDNPELEIDLEEKERIDRERIQREKELNVRARAKLSEDLWLHNVPLEAEAEEIQKVIREVMGEIVGKKRFKKIAERCWELEGFSEEERIKLLGTRMYIGKTKLTMKLREEGSLEKTIIRDKEDSLPATVEGIVLTSTQNIPEIPNLFNPEEEEGDDMEVYGEKRKRERSATLANISMIKSPKKPNLNATVLVSRGEEALAAAELSADPLSLTKMDVESKGEELSAAARVSADPALLEKRKETVGDDKRVRVQQKKGETANKGKNDSSQNGTDSLTTMLGMNYSTESASDTTFLNLSEQDK